MSCLHISLVVLILCVSLLTSSTVPAALAQPSPPLSQTEGEAPHAGESTSLADLRRWADGYRG